MFLTISFLHRLQMLVKNPKNRLCWICLLLVQLVPEVGLALPQCQWYEPIDCWNRKSLAELWADAGAAKMDMTAQIAAARAKFWATYPNKPGFEEAASTFAQLLNNKDIYYLNTYISVQRMSFQSMPGRPGTPEDAMDLVMGGTRIDNGIPDSAEWAFRQWTVNFKEHLDAAGGLFSPNMVQNALKAMEQSQASHSRYLIARDWAEFDTAGRIPVGFDNPEKYADLLYARFGRMSLQEAQENVHTMGSIYGDALVLRAAGEVLHAPKTKNGNLVNHAPDVPAIRDSAGARVPDLSVPQPPEVIGIYSSQLEAFELICARAGDKGYTFKLLADAKPHGPAGSRQSGKWAFAEKAYAHYVNAYGEAAVLQAAHAVRTATKQLYDGEVMHPEAIGAVHHDPQRAFGDVLAKKDPAGAVKLILAFDPGANSRAELNTAYTKLVAQYTEPKIFAAMQQMATTNPSPEYGEYKYLLRSLGAGGAACDPVPGVAPGGKGAQIGGKAGKAQGSDCPTESSNAPSADRENVQQQPYIPNPELPHYELTESRAASGIFSYCSGIYNPAQPLLTQREIQTSYAKQGAVDADVKRCVSWFDVRHMMVDRKQAMRYCIVKYDFMNPRTGASRKQYDTCMNEHDMLTALCTVEFRNRIELNRKKGFESGPNDNRCAGDAPGDMHEHDVVKFGGSEDWGHFKVPESGPELPAVLKAPFPPGVLHEQLPVQNAAVSANNAPAQRSQARLPASAMNAGEANQPTAAGGAVPNTSDPAPKTTTPSSTTKPARRKFGLPFALPTVAGFPGTQRNTATATPAAEMTNRLVADSSRAQNARVALQRMQQSQRGSTAFPNDVVAARARLDNDLRTAATAMAQNPNAAESAFVQLEQTVAVLERFLAGKS